MSATLRGTSRLGRVVDGGAATISRVLRLLGDIGAAVLPVLVVVIVAVCSTAGVLQRSWDTDHPEGGYPAYTALVAANPARAILWFLGFVAAYAALMVGLRWLARRMVRPSRARAAAAAGRLRAVADWVFARSTRLMFIVLVLWLPLFVLRWPGAINPDFGLMVTEIAMTRSEFAPGALPPFDVYPIAHAQIPETDLLWSNQHNAFMTLFYGLGAGASGVLFHSYLPAIAFFATTQAVFTVFAFGRALFLIGRLVPSVWVRIVGLLLVVGNPLIPLWAMDLSKNPLFAAAFVWWLALLIDFALGRRPASRRWMAEMLVATVLILVSVKFGVILVLVAAVGLLLFRRGWKRPLAAVVVPTAIFFVLVQTLFASGLLIRDDAVESKAMQIQQVAYTLRAHPDALSPGDRAALERIFDIDAMTAAYKPGNADPVKSSGYFDKNSYRWQTVTDADWAAFNGVWLRLGAEHPLSYVNAALLKSYQYLDPRSTGASFPVLIAWDWSVSYSMDVSPMNPDGRALLVASAAAATASPWISSLVSASVWSLGTIFFATVAVSLRRRAAYLWSIPVALQVGVALLAPLNGSGRYLLGVMYAAGFAFLLLGVSRSVPVRAGRARRERDEPTRAPAVTST